RANDGTHGFELWKSDGTTDGTVLVHDIVLGSDSGWVPQAQPVSGNGLLYFLADDGIHGTELWKSDGTPAGTTIVADVQTGPQSSFPSSLITVNETLFFSADDGVHGRELWKSDGTMLGTQLVLDLHAGTAPSLSFYGEFVRVNELLYFSATDGVAAYELWRSDGTESGTILVADISQGGGGSYPMFLTAAGDFVYFAADDGIHGFELWKSDGTAAGTTLLLDATEDAIGSSPYLITRSGNHIYFAATTEIYGTELYTAPKADPIITWTKPADITFGALLGASQLNASASVAGTFVYSPAAGTQLSASANQQLSVTFTPTDTLNYNNAIASVLIDVLKADPIITWNAPSDVTFGTPLSNTQLNATANVAGTFAYSRAVGTQLNAGADQQLSVTFTPTDTLNYNNAVASVLIDVLKVDPIITWNAPSDITFGTPLSNTQLNATANVAGTFAYSRAVGTELNAGADQQLSVTFTPTDTLNYNNAVASVLIDVLKADPIITWAKPADITFGALLGASQLNASASIAGTFVYSPAAGTQLNASANQQLSVTFTPTDTLNYNNAVASVLIDVLKADPVITWNAPSDITFGTPLSNTQLDATANVAGTFAYTPAVGTQLNAGADQQLSVTFTPADTLNYNNAVASVTIGVVRLFDYGDAPSALQSGFKSDYPVTITNDGARHSESLLFLGSLIDTETDGQVSDLAGQDGVEGDDGIGVDDEDGVRFVTTLVAQGGVASTSSVVVTASGAGKLDAWIDFNRDGDWLDAGEQILSSIQVAKGDNTLTFSVPAGATAGRTFARFRLSSTGGLAPTGVADDGEVEDYLVELVNGDVVSGVDVVIASIGAEPIELVTEGNQVILRRGGTELFRASQASLRTIDVAGTDGDDTLDIADVSLIVSGKLTGNFGSGTDVLRLTGGNQTLSLAQIVEANIHGLDLIDITGIGANSLTLGSADVRAISEITKTLRVQHNSDDTVTYVGKWAAGLPELVAGQFLHVLTLGDTSVRVVNSVPFHNPLVASDTDRDGRTSPLDALIIINQLNATGPQALSQPSSVVNLTNFYYVDINHDGAIAPIDVLVIINVLNASIGIAEHEYAASPLLPSSFPSLMVTMTSQETKTRVAFDIPIGFATQPPASMATRNQPPVLASWRNSLQVAPSRQDLDELIDAVDAFFAELGSMIE
ncbi:MAG: hypothetical protein H6821_07385, partial [Planctomycetaceae bacterium]|nr:hypothetical protein [Planctomycetaceae bacterium]